MSIYPIPPAKWPPGDMTTSMGRAPFTDKALDFGRLPVSLQGMKTHAMYLTPTGDVFDLAGPRAGRQGVTLATQLFGDKAWPFSQVITNSPYIFGADIQRQNIAERKFNLGVIIGSHRPQMTEYQYRMADAHWWQGQDETQDGWLGLFNRFMGHMWIPVRPDETVKTPQQIDPTAYGNNAARWDITWMASRPYATKPADSGLFEARNVLVAKPPPSGPLVGLIDQLIGDTYYWGTIPLANGGDLASFVTLYVTSPGQAIVQDNSSNRLVPLPYTVKSVGTYMCDTESGHRTLTAANDPQDSLIADLIRQSQILNFFLSGLNSGSTPLQLQFQNRFMFAVPPKTVVQLTVGHSDPNGQILAVLPQRFKRM